ncbi:conserved unknown protein [Ectocarpus siliculosus]|uniref:Uncharacterized protein n=1 Tax=Ectocarpus siliculosus TaxID=2880 RepID=D8LNT9_ECTSI|nr:conserved unknown protein [Ectocarpus siliculosus]|eukprot:CBN78299.1 conserved unknown protein [Ectocarpus siliculosus]
MEVTEDSAVKDFLEILEEHRRNCERQGKYVEAEIAKNRLDELKLHEENRRKEAMRSRQIAERLGVEEAHMLEFQQFNMVWDKRMADYEHHAEDMVFAMRERHGAELRDYQRRLLQAQPRPKFSRELLDLRRIQEHLAKAKDYAEAHKMKLKSDALEAWELEQWRNKRQADLCQRESKFKHGKAQEMAALLQRVMAGREEQKKQRQMDLERLLQRYQNVKSELEAQQKLERIRAERQSSSMGRVSAPSVHKKATTVKHSATGGGGARGGRRSSKHGA